MLKMILTPFRRSNVNSHVTINDSLSMLRNRGGLEG